MTTRELTIWRWALVCLALLSGLANMVDLPMEPHETFVVRTAEEMHDRKEWVVPYLNDRPRLNKPPLSYWFTAVVAEIAGDLHRVAPWEGRLVSVLAGAGLVAITGLLGVALAGHAVGLMATAIAASSQGFFYYSHSARPEMLYAFWCALGLLAFVRAWQAGRADVRLRWVLGMWVAFALACLTKGPQLPLMLVLALALFTRLHAPLRSSTLDLIRPMWGLLILAAVNLPWWYAMRQGVGAEVLQQSQLGGALLRPRLPDGDPYYFYRTWQLVLPWVGLLPALMMLRRAEGQRPMLLWLGLVIAVPAALLSFGPQERWYYMLPVLPALCLLLAVAAMRFWNAERLRRWMPLWVLVHGSLMLAVLIWAYSQASPLPWLPLAGIFGLIALCTVAWRGHRRGMSLPGWLLITALLFMTTTVSVAYTPQVWGLDRYQERDSASRLARLVRADEPLVSWRSDLTNLIYYLDRPIPRAEHSADLTRLHAHWVLAPTRTAASLIAAIPVSGHCALDIGDGYLWLIRVDRGQHPSNPALNSPDCDRRPLPAPAP
ncbi:MAG TPA: glycosyltransferase family 39 protein [Candidatus Macondimonas sp.]|nr:glycosyltransferase family 39 protein [Candidatus Macondimonas sp.]